MVFVLEETQGLTLREIASNRIPIRIPISQYLQHIDWYFLVKYVEHTCYKRRGNHFRYDPLIMLKLVVVKFYRQQSYRDTLSSISDEDCRYLGLPWSDDGFAYPAPSTLHHFVKYRLKEEGFEMLMTLIGKMFCRDAKTTAGIMDSTPLEASRYDQYAEFNPHYRCKMYKAHLFHLGNFPVFCCFSGGTEPDSTYASALIKGVKTMNPKITTVFADAGYDAFQIHADIFCDLHARPYIDWRENAVSQIEGTVDRIDHWVNKMWKEGGSIHDTLGNKLEFLYKHGRSEQVGMYLRNQNLNDPNFDGTYAQRTDCERTHNHIKSLVKFDVRKICNASKRLYVLANFVVYQILLLGHLQNKILPVQQFAHYF